MPWKLLVAPCASIQFYQCWRGYAGSGLIGVDAEDGRRMYRAMNKIKALLDRAERVDWLAVGDGGSRTSSKSSG